MIEATICELRDLFRECIEENTVFSAGSITEISKLPVIVLSGPILTEKKRLMRDPERITEIDTDAGKALREIPPRWYDLKFDVNVSCESYPELIRLIAKCSRLNQAHPLLTAEKDGRTRQYLWRWLSIPNVSTTPNISQVYQGHGELVIYDVEIYSGIREEVSLIENISAEIYNEIEEEKASLIESISVEIDKEKIEVQS